VASSARRPSLALLVDQQRDALDQLAAEIGGGIRNATHYNELEAAARSIGRGLNDAFRKGRVA